MASRRLFIHIGLQKTGTSYLQRILWDSQEEVARQGVDLVPGTKLAMFRLMLDVRQRYNPATDPASVTTALARLAGQLDRAQDTALISQESLSAATDEQIARLLAGTSDREVHVVVTLRDLGRQIPSAWQQTLQSGKSTPLEVYLRRLEAGRGRDESPSWSTMDAPAILARWGAHVPGERIHVITVPPSGSPQDALLERFCTVVGIDHTRLTIDTTTRANRSLRAEQAEVLRQVNERLPAEFKKRAVYGDLGKRYFAVKVLGAASGTRIQLPGSHQAWCMGIAEEFIDAIEQGGYRVVGDLDDLRPRPDDFAAGGIAVQPEQVTAVAAQAMSDMLVDLMHSSKAGAASAPGQAPSAPTGLRSASRRVANRARSALRRRGRR